MSRERRTVNWLRVAVYTTLTCFCLLSILGRSAFGQVDEGAITGTVHRFHGRCHTQRASDPGEYGPGHHTRNQIEQHRRLYLLPRQSRATTRITVTAKGFAKTTQKNLKVDVCARYCKSMFSSSWVPPPKPLKSTPRRP